MFLGYNQEKSGTTQRTQEQKHRGDESAPPLIVIFSLTIVSILVTSQSSAIIPDLTDVASLPYGERAFSGSFGVTGRSDPGTTKKPPPGGRCLP
jgi:hypothetical protein